MKIGTRVTWTSSGTSKEGVVTHIVAAGQLPRDVGVPRLDNSGLPRDHETYIVRGQHLSRGEPKGSKANYWPRASLLTFHEDGPSEVERLTLTLTAIAEFSVTDPGNMDAINMKEIAADALKPGTP